MTAAFSMAVKAPLSVLLKAVASSTTFKGIVPNLDEQRLAITGPEQVRPWLVGVMAGAQDRPVLVVTANGREAEDLASELSSMLGDVVDLFPSWETLPHERLSPGVDIVGHRARVLDRLGAGQCRVVVAAARALSQPIVDTAIKVIELRVDQECLGLADRLTHAGYHHVDLVAKRGEFATRGGIIDVFPTTADFPVRVEFWGDEVSDLRPFSVADQRTLTLPEGEELREVQVYPCRTLLVDDAVSARAQDLAREHAGNPSLAELLTKIGEGMYTDGMETLIPALTDAEYRTLPQLLPEGSYTVVVAPEKVRTRIHDLQQTDEEFLAAAWEAAAMGAEGPIATSTLDLSAASYRSLESLERNAMERGGHYWTLDPTGMGATLDHESGNFLPLEPQLPPAPHGDLKAIEALMATLKAHTHDGGAAAFIAPAAATIKRMKQRFTEAGIPTYVPSNPSAPKPGHVTLYHALNHAGIIADNAKGYDAPLVVITETDLTGNRVGDLTGAKRRPARKRHKVDPLALQTGDLVVHDTHGIGRFVKMTERTITAGDETSRREYVVLEYAPSRRGGPPDQLYVPMDSLDMLSRYVGGESPALSKMGGSDWKNTKKKARAAVREIAGELVELYAKRQAAPGHAFAPDTPWQREMEDNFPFVETEDQMLAIDAVKEDMEKPVPMDRVVIGDVGYGKTEVAVRAAFKAVQDGKQVAVLVPTTLLAQQHLATFTSRTEGFPLTIRGLSRFTSTREAKETLAGLADGTVDIVIGTHRLLQTGVQWKNLGLVVVDEEQRFGVEHKEHIKALRSAVDMLTMSATPIPRTLEMSMAGIREMSTILTPPEDRHPVLTYVGQQEDKHIAASIRRELLRDGQVFYVHNKVKTIDKRARELRDLVPEARIVVAHGQMSEEQLEQTVQGFWNREYDVLVCTTIVETGLDISNANTLIVENAHHMGLSQLHQLRGRVGRSRERGYAYFLYPKGAILSENSYDRLATIAQNNDLGAGMAVAMKDLEMRGAGNVLGAEQSGHIAGVGFDLYMRLVGDAVQAYRALADGTPVDGTDKEPREIRIDLPVDAHIPEQYVASERLRLEIYRKLAQSNTDDDLDLIAEELIDRYGPLPTEVSRLFSLAQLRNSIRPLGVNDVGVQGTRIKMHPVELPDSRQVRLKRLFPGATYRAAAKTVVLPFPKTGNKITDPTLRDVELLQWVGETAQALLGVD